MYTQLQYMNTLLLFIGLSLLTIKGCTGSSYISADEFFYAAGMHVGILHT